MSPHLQPSDVTALHIDARWRLEFCDGRFIVRTSDAAVSANWFALLHPDAPPLPGTFGPGLLLAEGFPRDICVRLAELLEAEMPDGFGAEHWPVSRWESARRKFTEALRQISVDAIAFASRLTAKSGA